MGTDLFDESGELVSVLDQIRCVEREIAMRHRVYPSLIARGRMTDGEARLEIRQMAAVLATLRKFSGRRRQLERPNDVDDGALMHGGL